MQNIEGARGTVAVSNLDVYKGKINIALNHTTYKSTKLFWNKRLDFLYAILLGLY
jgi:hypothetical protein